MNESIFLKNVLETSSVDNMYEKVIIVARRARQIAEHRGEDFYRELDSMGILDSQADQIINMDGWQEILAKTYEDQESPLICAKRELADGKIVYSYTKES